MQLEILKQVQNDNYQGIIHKKCHAEFISASRIIGFIGLFAFFGLIPSKKRGVGVCKVGKIHYNPKLKDLAKNLRNNSTRAEIILWNYLKGKKLKGYDFHRQKPIENFIVDFFCNKLINVNTTCKIRSVELNFISFSLLFCVELNNLAYVIFCYCDQTGVDYFWHPVVCPGIQPGA